MDKILNITNAVILIKKVHPDRRAALKQAARPSVPNWQSRWLILSGKAPTLQCSKRARMGSGFKADRCATIK